LAGSTTKKAVVRRYEKQSVAGWVNPASYLQPLGIEVLLPDGRTILVIPYEDVKAVSFVRDFSAPESSRRTFLTRPKMEGLWVNLRFRDGDELEGILPNNLLLVESAGFTVIPPDPLGNQQRLFVPRASLQAIEVLGVVGSPLARRKAKPVSKDQGTLFDE
jgi:hypothetical protein